MIAFFSTVFVIITLLMFMKIMKILKPSSIEGQLIYD